jgi:hypothetical protein
MKKNTLTLTLAVTALMLSLGSCRTMAELEGDGYRIRTDTGGYGGYRSGPPHCPPGHAKKGWC